MRRLPASVRLDRVGRGDKSICVRFSNRPIEAAAFRLSADTVSMSLAGRTSLRAWRQGPSIMGFEDQAVQSLPRLCREMNGPTQGDIRTHLISRPAALSPCGCPPIAPRSILGRCRDDHRAGLGRLDGKMQREGGLSDGSPESDLSRCGTNNFCFSRIVCNVFFKLFLFATSEKQDTIESRKIRK
jgi:hypothetical protein